MLNLFKIKIPKEKAQEVTELASWTISWKVATSLRWGESKVYNKCFIKEADANEFLKQLKESALFLNTPIETEKVKN